MKKISFAGPWITQKEIDYVIDATCNGFYETYDAYIKKLERTVANYLGVKHTIATVNCTTALHLAAMSLGFKEGDEVIVPEHSWIATAYAIAYTGAECVFVDIDPDTWCIDPWAIEKAITPRTRAIMLVHTFGHPAQMDGIMAIAHKYNLRVIEDAAPSLGAEFRGQKVGTFGDCGCFSFQGAKLAVCGEGGIFVTNRDDVYEKALMLATMGRTDSQAVFWSDSLGYQYTIANLMAALALAQVERIEELLSKKRQVFNWYYERLKGNLNVKIVTEKDGCKSTYCYPFIVLEGIDRDEVLRGLKELNIHCRPAFPRMSQFPVFERRFENPVAVQVERQGMCLASAANLTEDDIDFVCENLVGFIGS